MVEVQGTYLDSIDSNIDNTIINVSQGTKEIEKTYEYKRGCKTTICIIIMIIIIVILSTVIGLEYTVFKN